jgi:hypothetical protein
MTSSPCFACCGKFNDLEFWRSNRQLPGCTSTVGRLVHSFKVWQPGMTRQYDSSFLHPGRAPKCLADPCPPAPVLLVLSLTYDSRLPFKGSIRPLSPLYVDRQATPHNEGQYHVVLADPFQRVISPAKCSFFGRNHVYSCVPPGLLPCSWRRRLALRPCNKCAMSPGNGPRLLLPLHQE